MDHSRKTMVCLLSAAWASVVTMYTIMLILHMDSNESFFGHLCKILTMSLGAIQFILSGMLLSHIQQVQTIWTKRYYQMYLLTAVTTSTIYLFYYLFKNSNENSDNIFWGFTWFDLILYIDIFIFVIFIICYPTPKPNPSNARFRAMNIDWIARNVLPERVIPSTTDYGIECEKPKYGEHRLESAPNKTIAEPANTFTSTRVNLTTTGTITSETTVPYSRMEDESMA